ncbi:YciI family protein [Microbacterium sp. CJ88]|uniref:YciI family protein n=1 Tax=Microbacterium sp. CJ88 TaxID=3445672 RepID=UPI003F659E3E
MRYMLIFHVSTDAPTIAPDSAQMGEVIAAMGRYNEELIGAGVFLSAEGLSDASEGFRIDFGSTPPVVTDGPFAEAREVFTGFWILEVASREEAQQWALKCPLGPGASLEVRRVNEIGDFDPEVGGEWIAKEQEWRAAHS